MTDLERLARVLYPKIAWAYKWGPVPYEQLNDHAKDTLSDTVRAILTELREPSEGMVDAAEEVDVDDRDLRAVFRAMIDHILEGK